MQQCVWRGHPHTLATAHELQNIVVVVIVCRAARGVGRHPQIHTVQADCAFTLHVRGVTALHHSHGPGQAGQLHAGRGRR